LRTAGLAILSLVLTLLLVGFSGAWQGQLIGGVLMAVGTLAMLVGSGKVRSFCQARTGHSISDLPGSIGAACFVFGVTTFSSSYLLAHVEGRVDHRRASKGNTYVLVVGSGPAPGDILGNTDDSACQAGMFVEKKSFSMAYRCDGRDIPTASYGIYPAVVVELLICAGLVLWVFTKKSKKFT
jgi:hypothetical protein